MRKTSGASEALTPKNGNVMINTPGKSAGISKTLLTPCRRLGLSRKFKSSPASNPNQDSTNSSASNPESLLKSREASTEPPSLKRNEKSAGKSNRSTSSRANIQARFESQPPKEQLNPVNVELPACQETPEVENYDIAVGKETKRTTKRTRQVNKSDITSDLSNGTKSITGTRTNAKPPEQPATVLVTDSRQSITKSSPENDLKRQPEASINISNDLAEKHLEESSREEPKTKINMMRKDGTSKTRVRRCLSMKKSLSCSQDELADVTDFEDLPATPKTTLLSQEFTNECLVQLETIMQVEGNNEESKSVDNKSNKKRRFICSSDEEDFVPSQNSIKKDSETDKSVEVDWDLKIHEIKARIKIKEGRLEDLKRASIYQKLHNVDNLEQLRKVWKTGCITGLRHLLPKLQEHGLIDMPNLLKKLNIPQKYLKYDVDSDSFN